MTPCTTDIPLEVLRSMSAFGALSDAFIERLLERGQLLWLRKGETLYRKGEQADCFFIVMEGHVTVYDDTDLGRHIIRTTDTGESVGFPAMIGLRPRLFTGEASCTCSVLRISSSAFADLYDWDQQQFAIFFMNLSRDMSRFLRYSAGGADTPRVSAVLADYADKRPLQPGLRWSILT
ncbi:cyclic nucleotide-binding domain-containing protein [Marinobacterium aestuariivivens]|uniref:Cyclic nucleotide-binding domain-containing protein n=1 Tax=Marinobacterium aestuariivivens TaxID=1698799 RepID=A0ABW2A5B5_9GAMM